MNKKFRLLLILPFLIFSQSATATPCSQNNNVLNGLVGLDGSLNRIYANTNSISNECSCTSVRFTSANIDTNMALSILLSAKIANKEVRIDLLDGLNCDSAYRVYVE